MMATNTYDISFFATKFPMNLLFDIVLFCVIIFSGCMCLETFMDHTYSSTLFFRLQTRAKWDFRISMFLHVITGLSLFHTTSVLKRSFVLAYTEVCCKQTYGALCLKQSLGYTLLIVIWHRMLQVIYPIHLQLNETHPLSSVARALDQQSKGRWFESRAGRKYLSDD